ncbi:transferase family-domain-containing protein [Xylariomycetidae sp. FL2044]|nr:transferase family-domain-containing protein [Xylariomycetidae sp. FL2044]
MSTLADPTYLSPIDRLMPKAYVSQVICFPSTDPRIIQQLEDGLSGVALDLPFLLSGVTDSRSQMGASHLTEPHQTPGDLISWQDLSSSIDYGLLKNENFPPSAFNFPEIRPPVTVPPFPDPAPVFRARISLVKGGCIVLVAVHHRVTDITGLGAILKVWASCCRTGTSAAVGFDSAWLDRKGLVGPLEKNTAAPASTPNLIGLPGVGETTKTAGTGGIAGDYKTAVFFFAEAKLQELKQVVNQEITGVKPGTWVSTGDIVTALLWSAVTRAQNDLNRPISLSHDTVTPGVDSTIDFPVNIRAKLQCPLPKDYVGAAFVMTSATVPLAKLLSLSDDTTAPEAGAVALISSIAGAVRESVNNIKEEDIWDMLSYVEAHPDLRTVTYGRRHGGISIVSWADEGVYELDWGNIIGRCDAVRVGKMPHRRYPIVLPRIPNSHYGGGGLEVILSLEREVIERLQETWPMRTYSELRCLV